MTCCKLTASKLNVAKRFAGDGMFESMQEFERMSQQLEQYQRWATGQSQHSSEPEVDPSGIDKPVPMNYI